ncbi:hypothetical protein BURKHO8Y_180204 [Burkholderia sp. 8Y]|nr:hypothetical protein BURKHO8Y_180204 [Burkholderia sp. 8Y]
MSKISMDSARATRERVEIERRRRAPLFCQCQGYSRAASPRDALCFVTPCVSGSVAGRARWTRSASCMPRGRTRQRGFLRRFASGETKRHAVTYCGRKP